MPAYVIAIWIVCGILGGVIGSAKNAGGMGFVLGLLFGPLGVIASFAVDGRQQCPQCHGRVNWFPILCQHCGAKLEREAEIQLERPTRDELEREDEYVRRIRARRGK